MEQYKADIEQKDALISQISEEKSSLEIKLQKYKDELEIYKDELERLNRKDEVKSKVEDEKCFL